MLFVPLAGHHAMEFIELESYNTAPVGAFVFHLHHDYLVDDPDLPTMDHWELTPGMSYGISDKLMVDIHGHFAKFGVAHLTPQVAANFHPMGPSPFLEAIAVAVQYRITDHAPINIGLSIGYEEPLARSKDLLDGQRAGSATLIMSKPFANHSNLTVNFITEIEAGEAFYRWGLGFRSPLTMNEHGIAAGIEILGSEEDKFTLLPGIYFPLGMEDIIFKTGLEFDPDDGVRRSNLTLMYRF